MRLEVDKFNLIQSYPYKNETDLRGRFIDPLNIPEISKGSKSERRNESFKIYNLNNSNSFKPLPLNQVSPLY